MAADGTTPNPTPSSDGPESNPPPAPDTGGGESTPGPAGSDAIILEGLPVPATDGPQPDGGEPKRSDEGGERSARSAGYGGDGSSDVAYQREAKRPGFAALIEGATRSPIATGSHGVANYYEKYVGSVTNFGSDPALRIFQARFQEAWVETERTMFCPTIGFDPLVTALKENRVLVVRGRAGSGRRTAAIIAMLECGVASDKVSSLVLAEDVELIDVCRSAIVGAGDRPAKPAVVFEDGEGYLINCDDRPVSMAAVEVLQSVVAGARTPTFVVVLAGRAKPFDDDLGALVLHFDRPPPVRVIHHRLSMLLDDPKYHAYIEAAKSCVEGRADEIAHVPVRMIAEVADALAGRASGTAAAAGAAEVIADVDAAFARFLGGLREIAERALKGLDDDTVDWSHRSPRGQAFRLAYAVFHGLPLTDAFDASTVLLRQILPKFEMRSPRARAIFDGGLEGLLTAEMVASHRGSTSDDSEPAAARLIHPLLSRMFLDVAWHDFDFIRRPLLSWLSDLASYPRLRVRVRAAQVAGLLATFDFEEVDRLLLDLWAQQRNAWFRQAAANALELAWVDERVRGKVMKRIEKWTDSPNPLRQDVAARAYGTRIGTADPELALRALHKLAVQPDLAAAWSIGLSMASLFGENLVNETFDELGEWIKPAEPQRVHRHAVRTLIILARTNEILANNELPTDGFPTLASAVIGRPAREGVLAAVWREALLMKEPALRGWPPLRSWLLTADAEETSAAEREVIERIVWHTVNTTDLEARAKFQVRLWLEAKPDSAALWRLADKLWPTTQGDN